MAVIAHACQILNMNLLTFLKKKSCRVLLFSIILFSTDTALAQKTGDWHLEKMPAQLETDFALSALPAYLRANATVYLLDPNKGYYVSHKGTNGFLCFVSRTAWEWGEFRQDLVTPISYDAVGAASFFKIEEDMAAMRASGKYSGPQVRSIIVERIKKGEYKVPSRQGISFMLSPIMRSYNGPTSAYKDMMTMNMPHYMFYAPYLTSEDIGNTGDVKNPGPFVANASEPIFGRGKSPYGFIIVPVGKAEKAKIMKETEGLMKRLIAYKAYLKPGSM